MYVITIKAKRGEKIAISSDYIPAEYQDKFIPNVCIETITDIPDFLNKRPTSPIWIDLRNLDSQNQNEINSLEQLIQENLAYQFTKIVYPFSYVKGNSVETHHCMRIQPSDFNPVNESWIQTNLNSIPDTILIDLGYIKKVPDSKEMIEILEYIRLFKDKEIVLSSGSIPENLKVNRTTDFIQPRYEKQFYQQLSKQSPTPIIYGDYGIVSPIPIIAGGPIIPTVQLKYTRDDSYLFVRNGKRKGGYDIKSVAQKLSDLPEFNEDHCEGEKLITEISLGQKSGNPATWVTIGMNHHIMLCIEENL
ncbi:beta family protein [Streptococcus sanguinis]|uniref:beta family protein n=1 Tax=Streptococcus sanguinis TaxID=1305 RepID=UPI0031B596B7